jgi:WD40 repeat protein
MQILKGYRYNEIVWAVAFTPDGRELLSVGARGEILRWDLAGGTHQKGDCRRGYMPTLALSPDGRWLARSVYARVVVLDKYPGGEPRILECAGHIGAIRFSPDGQVLATAARSLYRWDTASWSPLPADWLNLGERCTALAYSSDGQTLALACGSAVVHAARRTASVGVGDYRLRLLDATTGARKAELTGPTGQITCVALRPDGRYAAAAAGQFLWVWEVATRKSVLQERVDTRHFKELAFTPDGCQLLTVRNDETVRVWDTGSWTQTAAYNWDIGGLVSLAIAADGMRAAAGGKKGRIIVWDLDL